MTILGWYKKLRKPQWYMLQETRRMKNGILSEFGRYPSIHQIPAHRALKCAKMYAGTDWMEGKRTKS